MTHQIQKSGHGIPRSQSATRIRHSVDHSASELRRKSLAQPQERNNSKPPSALSLQTQDSPAVSRRRGSSVRFQNSPKPGSSPSCRSKSLKSPSIRRNSKTANISNGTNGNPDNNDHRAFSYSLSVPGDENEYHRQRNFSITPKGVINRGDSFRCKSSSTSRSSSPKTPPAVDNKHLHVPDETLFALNGNQDSAACSPNKTENMPTTSASSAPGLSPRYRLWIMGLSGVGKTSLKLQFMTSEYICQYDNWRDENAEKNVTIFLDNEEYELEITEWSGFNEKSMIGLPLADAFLVVYSVANRRSYIQAKHILSKIEPLCSSKAVILVGNKTDLARLRTVNTLEGRSLAKEWGCKFIETSVAINHQVDELLVGVITQIRIKTKLNEKQKKNGETSTLTAPTRTSKATGIIKRLWRKTCMTNKSCDNLHCV